MVMLSASCPHCRGLSPGGIPGPEELPPTWTPWPPSPLLLTSSQANPEAPKIPKTLPTLIVTSIPLPLKHGVHGLYACIFFPFIKYPGLGTSLSRSADFDIANLEMNF